VFNREVGIGARPRTRDDGFAGHEAARRRT
jgi:hypothetical protein